MQFVFASFVCVVLCVAYVRADSYANVQIVTAGNCGDAILSKHGIDPKHYKPRIQFDPKKVRIEPKKPKIPGCFRVIASNVTITEPMKQITAEVEMRISGDADPSKPTLKCKRNTKNCGCGSENSCNYCDFCKNIHKLLGDDVKINNKKIDVDAMKEQCDCNIPADKWEVDLEVCTPDEDEASKMVPTRVLDAVTDGQDFSLFTTLLIYNFRYNALTAVNSAAKKVLDDRKAKGLSGCYVIGTNVDVN